MSTFPTLAWLRVLLLSFIFNICNCDSTLKHESPSHTRSALSHPSLGAYYNTASEEREVKIPNLSKHPIVIVISFDGFRFDYFKRAQTPTLDFLKSTGSSVPYMRNQFITKTFPNHVSISTGLHAESHGVVDNDLFDPLYNMTLNGDSDIFWNQNNDTIPLWTLNEMAGEGRKSGVMMWPGSNHKYNGILPSRVESWNESIPFRNRIDRVLQWITDDKEPTNLVFMYFEEPDEYAHAFGPESPEVTEKIQNLDNATKYLVDQLKTKRIFDRVNLIILSDHGFQEVKQQDMINISSIVDPSLYDLHGSTPVLQLLPKPGQFDNVYNSLKMASNAKNFSVYSKQELAQVKKDWYFSKNRRILDIIVVADLGFIFEDFAHKIKWYDSHFNRTPSPANLYGVHGYDNKNLMMHPFFLSHGPAFKRKFIGDPFDNIDLFPMICKILGIDTPPNNGTLENVKSLLVAQGGFAVGSPVGWAIGAGVLFGVLILLGIMSILVSTRGRDRRTRLSSESGSTGYRFINRQNSYDSADESNQEFGGIKEVSRHYEETNDGSNLGEEEFQALLGPSTEDV